LVCEEYSEEMVNDDDLQTVECFDSALEECHKEDEKNAQQQIFDQEKQIEDEKKRLEGEYNKAFQMLKDTEKKKILQMKKQYADIDQAVKIRADNLKLLKIENKKQQEYHDQQLRELKELAKKNYHPGMRDQPAA
jgi:formate-dependent nitrite reductase cytochrome c552 subunit